MRAAPASPSVRPDAPGNRGVIRWALEGRLAAKQEHKKNDREWGLCNA